MKTKKQQKKFTMDISFEVIEISVFASNKTEARKKILQKLSHKNPCSLINKKLTYLDEN